MSKNDFVYLVCVNRDSAADLDISKFDLIFDVLSEISIF